MKYILYILMFALATVIIFSWGIIKEQNKSKDLMSQLYKKAETKVLKAFNKKQVLTKKDIENEVKNIKASLFYSKDKMIVQNSSSFAKNIINTMINRNLIEKTTEGYVLKNN
ncbi:hypothetical protein [Terrisporobacter vanillatitrophus]|uniref:hypothetical protein n=1 Tax=Terrisporobacter vanillatitrophus TaxID=3058402 RepID=UPI003365C085